MSRLPADVVTEILLKLPAKSLLRFKSVWKLWHELINDSVFINRQVEQSNKHIILRTSDKDFHMCDFDTLDNPRNLNLPLKNSGFKRLYFVGSCRGLLCFSSIFFRLTIFLYNPTTRTCKTFPYYLRKSDTWVDSKKALLNEHLVFGYDHLSQDYQCFIVSSRIHGFKPIMVYSLRHDTWKPPAIDSPCYVDGYSKRSAICSHRVYFNGVAHWAIEIRNKTYQHIVGLDLSKEALTYVPLPNIVALEFNMDIHPGVVDSCLFLIHNHLDSHHDIWIMKEYGVATSWTLMCRIEHDFRPVSFFKITKELLLIRSRVEGLDTWDLKTREIKIVQPPAGLHRVMDSFVYFENLLVLKGGIIEYVDPRERHILRVHETHTIRNIGSY